MHLAEESLKTKKVPRNHAFEAQLLGDWALYGEEIKKTGDLLRNAMQS